MEIKNNLSDNQGAVLIIIAFLIPVFILIVGAITDLGGAMMAKENLYKACLISAEESTKTIDILKAQQEGVNHLTDSFPEVIIDYFYKNISEKENFKVTSLNYHVYENLENPKYIEVIGRGSYATSFLKIINIHHINVSANAVGRLKKIN